MLRIDFGSLLESGTFNVIYQAYIMYHTASTRSKLHYNETTTTNSHKNRTRVAQKTTQ